MPKYLIERDMPGFGLLSPEELRDAARQGMEVAAAMGPADIHWLHSYVSGDKVFCVYYAANEELIREHSRRVGAPVTLISEITSVIDASYVD